MKIARKLILLLMIVVPVACSSAVVIHYSATPNFNGRVIDRETQQPIAGATVFVKEDPSEKTATLPDGYFFVGGAEKAFSQSVFGGNLNLPMPSGTLVVEADGYKRLETGKLAGQWVTEFNLEMDRL